MRRSCSVRPEWWASAQCSTNAPFSATFGEPSTVLGLPKDAAVIPRSGLQAAAAPPPNRSPTEFLGADPPALHEDTVPPNKIHRAPVGIIAPLPRRSLAGDPEAPTPSGAARSGAFRTEHGQAPGEVRVVGGGRHATCAAAVELVRVQRVAIPQGLRILLRPLVPAVRVLLQSAQVVPPTDDR